MSLLDSARVAVAAPPVVEHSLEDLAVLRYLLDLALQPVNEFDGFTHIDQVGPAALRYQLNFISYALAMSQYTRTPAFTGYLAEAQRNLIDKMCIRRIWSYWFWQNLIGNWRWNPDPVVHQNVMYSGFFGTMIGLYETLNPDTRYSTAGSLPLQWNAKTRFDYDYASLAGAIRDNMHKSRWTQYACEPHLVYPMCNTFALNAMHLHDQRHNTDITGDLVERVRESHTRDGFLRDDGRFLTGRGPLGLKFGVAIGNDAVIAYWLNALMPDRAQQTWESIRSKKLALVDSDSNSNTGSPRKRIEMPARGGDRYDVGNYTRSPVMMRALVMACAREMGDEAIASALQDELDASDAVVFDERDGVRGARHFNGISTWGNAAYALGRFSRHNGIRELIGHGVPTAWKNGPLLSSAVYPEVLVARAVSDGRGLDLVLQPGCGACHTTLEFAQLVPGADYRVYGFAAGCTPEQLVADADGTARIRISLDARVAFSLLPGD